MNSIHLQQTLPQVFADRNSVTSDIWHQDLIFRKGEMCLIEAASGTGKSSLCSYIYGYRNDYQGIINFDETNIKAYSVKQWVDLRKHSLSMLFQDLRIFTELTALENVELALQICKNPMDAQEVMEDVGLGERLDNFPAQLSGGEQQRVSIARALAKNPKLLLCDEPTGALDYNTGKAILKLLQDTCREKGMTVILITHNSAIAPMADRVIKIKNGMVSEMIVNEHPVPVETIEW